MIPAASSSAYRRSSTPRSSTRISWLCWPSVGAGAQPAVDRREPERHVGVAARPPPGGRSPRRSRRACSCGWSYIERGSRPTAAGTPCATSSSAASPTSRRAHHSPRWASSSSCRARRPAEVARSGRGAHAGRPERVDQTPPLLVGGDRDREPRLVVAPAVQPLRRDVRAAVAVALEQVAVGGRLQHQLGRGVERAFDHGHLEQAPTPGGLALGEPDDAARTPRACPRSGRSGRCWIRGWSSAWPVIHARPVTCSIVCAKPDVVAPRARQPERGHPHEEAARVDRADRAPSSSPKLPSTRGEKFSSTASLSRDQRAQQRQPVLGAEVEGEVALVGVRAQVVRAALPPRAVHAGRSRRSRACRRSG